MFANDVQGIESRSRPTGGRQSSHSKPDPTAKTTNQPSAPTSEHSDNCEQSEDEIDDHYGSIKVQLAVHG
tara:strand:- start:13 stop:222 length:210 start_codon:yes stop_codon:yes gene_type:complete